MKTRPTILVIDDEPVVRDVFAALLTRGGYDVRSAATAEEGLGLIRQLVPALVLLDVELPDGRGTEICRQIRSDPGLQDVFVILISGRALSVADKVEGLDEGADEYLTKPISGPELVARTRACLRLRDAKAALRSMERTLRGFLDAVTHQAVLLDRSGTILAANQSMADTLGLDSAALVGRCVFDLLPWATDKTGRAQFEQVIQSGRPVYFEEVRAERHFSNHLVPILDEARQVDRVAVYAVDITHTKRLESELQGANWSLEQKVEARTAELKAASEALRESRDRYQRLHESMTDAFVLTNMEGRILETNRAFQEMLGYTNAELGGLTYHDLTPEQWWAAEARIVTDQILPRGASGVYEKEYHRKNGQAFPVELRTFLLRDKDGSACGMWAIVRDVTERKQAEEALRRLNLELEQRVEQRTALLTIANSALEESEARYRELVMNQGEGLAIVDPDERITFINPAGADIFGAAPHSLIGRSLGEFMKPDQYARVQAETVRRRRGERSVYELEIIRADGQTRWVLVTAVPRMDTGSQLREIFGLFRDITERKEAETRLREQGERLNLALAAAQMVTWEWDIASGQIQYSDSEPATTLGDGLLPFCTTDDLLQQVHPDDRGGLAAAIQQTGDGGQTFDCEYRVRMPDGVYRWIWGKGRRMPLEDGSSSRVLGVSLDVTNAKQVEERVLRIQTALEASGVAVGMSTAEGVHVYQNAAFTKMFGYKVEELGQPMGPMVVFAQPEIGRKVFQTIMGGQPWHGELEMVAKDGRRFPVEERADAVKDAQGRIIGLIGLHTDISERKRAERQKEAFSRLTFELSGTDNVERAAANILEKAFELLGGDSGYVHVYEATRDSVRPVIAFDTIEGRRMQIDRATLTTAPTPLLRTIMAEGAKRLDRSAGEPLPIELVPFGAEKQLSASLLFAPIRAGRQCVGILSVQSYSPRAYSTQDLDTLQALADLCGDALQRLNLLEALRQAEARYRSIFENSTEGLFQSQPDGGRLISANPALARMLGYASPEKLGGEIRDLRQLYCVPELRDQFWQVMTTMGVARDFEVQLRHRNGRCIWATINAHVVRDEAGAILYFEGTIQDITQRKHAQDELIRSQRLQNSLLQNISDPAWLKDRDGRYLACNEALGVFYGLAPERLLGKTVREASPQEAERLQREDEVVLLSKKAAHFETRRADVQGRTRWFETVKAPVLNERGEATGTVGVARDITERKWAEEQLLRQRDLGLFLSAASEVEVAGEHLVQCARLNEGVDCAGLYLVDTHTGRLTLASQQGLPQQLRKHFLQVAQALCPLTGRHPARKEVFSETYVDRIAQGLNRLGFPHVEAIPIRAHRQVVAVLCICSRRGRVIPARSRHAVEAVSVQVGEAIARIRTEQTLGITRQLNERMLASLRAGVFVLDARLTTIIECNSAVTPMFGYRRDELLGQSFSRLHISERMFRRFRMKVLTAARRQEGLTDFEFSMATAKGNVFPAEHRLSPIQDAADRIIQWVGIVRDITSRKQFEQELRSISRRIIAAQEGERMRVARELHDGVNQTLASVRMRLRRVEELETGLSSLSREVLVRSAQLLSHALEENRRIAYNLRPAELDALGFVEACRSCCRRFQAQSHLSVTARLARLNVRLSAEFELNLFRILQEGLANVQKHARAKKVRVLLTARKQGVQLVIQDDGRGLGRGGGQPREKYSGIGLASMRERAGSMGGQLSVESVRGQGTLIRVLVPVPAVSSSAAATVKAASKPAPRQD